METMSSTDLLDPVMDLPTAEDSPTFVATYVDGSTLNFSAKLWGDALFAALMSAQGLKSLERIDLKTLT